MGDLRRVSEEAMQEEWARLLAGAGSLELGLSFKSLPGVPRAAIRKALARFESQPDERFCRMGLAGMAQEQREVAGPIMRRTGLPREAWAMGFADEGAPSLGRVIWVIKLAPEAGQAEPVLSLWGSLNESSKMIPPALWDDPAWRGGLGCPSGSMKFFFEMMGDEFHRQALADFEREQLGRAAAAPSAAAKTARV